MAKKSKGKIEPVTICDPSVEMQDKPAKIAATGDNFHSEIANCNIQSTRIESMIRLIRGHQVIIDRDLAILYNVETRRLNEQVKRNAGRFPEDFMFQLSKEEFEDWKSQFATSNSVVMGARKRPYAFTESGIAMLSSVLHSQTAIEMNIRIMRAFVAMRHFFANNAQIFQRLAHIEYHQTETDRRIDEVFKRLDANAQPQQGIFFDGQVFDAYQFFCDLVRKAKKSIVLIDNYVDDTVLTLLDKREKGVSATIYTQHISQKFQLDINRHNSQYPAIEVAHFNKAHDRFLFIDEEVYHIGASMKDLGKKWFGFTLMRDLTAADLLEKIKGDSL